jgi:ribulose-5-phosphate 4-epimerase/fuculose-1-phosphate aldolase
MGIMEENRARERFVALGRRAFASGLQRSTGGNLSLRLDDRRLLVKPSGFALIDLAPADLLLCDIEGRVLAGAGKPTKELASHLAIYAANPEVGGVAHYHPPYATAYAAGRVPLPLPTVHAQRKLGRVPLVDPPGEGSPALAAALGRLFADGGVRAALLAEHGVIAAGRDLDQAHNLAELVEESAQVAWLAAGLRHAPDPA